MNTSEIHFIKTFLHMNQYQRYTAHQAIVHNYFNLERAKDTQCTNQEDSSVNANLIN